MSTVHNCYHKNAANVQKFLCTGPIFKLQSAKNVE